MIKMILRRLDRQAGVPAVAVALYTFATYVAGGPHCDELPVNSISPFSAQDHYRLSEVLSHVKGRFILSYNDCPLVRELYADYCIEGITRTTTLAGNGNNQTQFPELIIRNF